MTEALVARLRRDEGQVIAFMAVGMLVVLLGVAGLVVDVGHAYLVKRQLQATADAAALAGAAVLPDTAKAEAVAAQYGAKQLNSHDLASVDVTEPTAQPWCLSGVAYCYNNTPGGPPTANPAQANGLVVQETATVPTTFMKLFGFDSMTVHAKAVACGLCGTQPLNIALVVDRTGSMSSNIGDLQKGLATFGLSLNPQLDAISLLVLPPAPGGSDCSPAASDTSYPLNSGDSYPVGSDDDYAVVHYSTDYLNSNGTINYGSRLVQQVACIAAAGSTAYKQALVAAADELANPPAGREKYQKVIVFETDGAANTAPDSDYNSSISQKVQVDENGQTTRKIYLPASGDEDNVNRPCGSALDYANSLKSQGVIILTVAYAVQPYDGCYIAPHLVASTTNGKTTYTAMRYGNSEGVKAADILTQMASPGDAFAASNAAEMSSAFAGIANKITGSSLVPDSDGP